MLHVGPVVIRYKDKDLLAAAGNDGSLALLDSGSLGGSDHHTPLAQTNRISKDTKKDAWESLASWKDKNDQLWVLASISGPVQRNVTFAYTNGDASHGSIIAFKVEEKNGHTVLTPGWISRDLRNPAPPVIANGVVFALSPEAKLLIMRCFMRWMPQPARNCIQAVTQSTPTHTCPACRLAMVMCSLQRATTLSTPLGFQWSIRTCSELIAAPPYDIEAN